MNESKLRKMIRSIIREHLSDGRQNKMSDQERKLREAVRREIRNVLSQKKEKGQLNEAVGGMVDLQAVGSGVHGMGRRYSDRQNFSYDEDAVRDRVARDLGKKRGRKKSNISERVTFVNEETQDSVALWIEDGQLVCEVKSSNGTQKTQLSEEKTKDVVQYILSESVLNLQG